MTSKLSEAKKGAHASHLLGAALGCGLELRRTHTLQRQLARDLVRQRLLALGIHRPRHHLPALVTAQPGPVLLTASQVCLFEISDWQCLMQG